MDHSLGPEEHAEIEAVLDRYRARGVDFHALRTRQSGRRAFVSLHVLVPGEWTVHDGHAVAERVDSDLQAGLPYATVFTHVEPREDSASYRDERLDPLE
jgi:divalent metal cation (Fe/Co/Zn/Cd) transporter